jgi:hypothetical protein
MSPLNINHTRIVNCGNHIHNTSIPTGLKKNFPIPLECVSPRFRDCDSYFRSGGRLCSPNCSTNTNFSQKKVFCSYHTVIKIVLIDMVILMKIGFRNFSLSVTTRTSRPHFVSFPGLHTKPSPPRNHRFARRQLFYNSNKGHSEAHTRYQSDLIDRI